jgi:predicted NBD/HSP70 family sugar kinase
MEYIGIDLHKTSSQICILSEDGELTERRIKSTRASFGEVFADRPRAIILVEASTESEWARKKMLDAGTPLHRACIGLRVRELVKR